MPRSLDLDALVETIGPRFAEGAADRDQGDVFGGLRMIAHRPRWRCPCAGTSSQPLRDARFHLPSAKRQQRFTGRGALGLDPIADVE